MRVLFPLLLLFASAHARLEAQPNTSNELLRKQRHALSLLSKVRFKPLLELEPGISAMQGTEWTDAVRRALNPLNGTECTSPLDDWTRHLIYEMGVEAASILIEYSVDQLALAYKIYVDMDETDEYFGVFGKETSDMILNHKKCETFWTNAKNGHTLNTDDIVLLGMHGSDLEDYSKLFSTLEALLEDGSNVQEAVYAYQEFIESLPRGYNNPLLTANAFASTKEVSPDGEILPDFILIGDGMIEYLRSQNLGRDGPEYIHSHEFAHHMQYEVDIGVGGIEKEIATDSRRIELMAQMPSAHIIWLTREGHR